MEDSLKYPLTLIFFVKDGTAASYNEFLQIRGLAPVITDIPRRDVLGWKMLLDNSDMDKFIAEMQTYLNVRNIIFTQSELEKHLTNITKTEDEEFTRMMEKYLGKSLGFGTDFFETDKLDSLIREAYTKQEELKKSEAKPGQRGTPATQHEKKAGDKEAWHRQQMEWRNKCSNSRQPGCDLKHPTPAQRAIIRRLAQTDNDKFYHYVIDNKLFER